MYSSRCSYPTTTTTTTVQRIEPGGRYMFLLRKKNPTSSPNLFIWNAMTVPRYCLKSGIRSSHLIPLPTYSPLELTTDSSATIRNLNDVTLHTAARDATCAVWPHDDGGLINWQWGLTGVFKERTPSTSLVDARFQCRACFGTRMKK